MLTIETTMPATATVGQTLPASFVLRNDSAADDPSFIVCDAGESGPCDGAEGIVVISSCGQGAGTTCASGRADPGVFSINEPATGAADTTCADMTFLVPSLGDSFGKVRFAPTGGLDVRLSQGEACRVDFTINVLKLPTHDAGPQPGVQTAAIVSATARSYLDAVISGGASTILTVTPRPPSEPSLTETDPDSPANGNAPKIRGTAAEGTTVSVYTDAACTGSPTAEGPASAFASPGLTAAVADNSTTTFHAIATDPSTALSSACSASSRTYVEDSTAPETTIDSGPLAATDVSAPVFTFSSDDAGAGFSCQLDGAALAPCISPLAISALASGPHTFQVWATDASGNADRTPASHPFTVASTDLARDSPPFLAGTTLQPTDLPGCTLKGNIITGTPEDDALRGTAKTDIVVGLSSDDVLRGLGARDCLFGGSGADRLLGGGGADLLFGGEDDDDIDGDAGDDRLDGGAGNDRIDGGAGGDRIDGGADDDTLIGGPGGDRLTDRRGTDNVWSGSGNDRIDARDGSAIDRRGRDRISCGVGRDIVLADAADVVARDCETVRHSRQVDAAASAQR